MFDALLSPGECRLGIHTVDSLIPEGRYVHSTETNTFENIQYNYGEL